MYILRNHKIILLLLLLFNLILYLIMILGNATVPFHKKNYNENAHHYIQDNRENKNFSLLIALAQYDAQWYLKIANEGYPKDPEAITNKTLVNMEGIRYAYFPLYPALISVINYGVKDILLSSLLLSWILLIATTLSLYYVVKELFTSSIAIKSSILLFLFPFSIFFRSYYAESLFLLLLLWFCYFLLKKKHISASFIVSLLTITKGNAFPCIPLLILLAWKQKQTSPIKRIKYTLTVAIIGSSSVMLWMLFNYYQTGNPLYFLYVRHFLAATGIEAITFNIMAILNFPFLPLHSFHFSNIEVFFIVVTGCMLYKSKKHLPRELWWISIILYATPLLSKTMMSFTRYQITSFPLFVYLALTLSKRTFILISLIFTIGLCLISLYFINWYWIG